MIDEIWQNNGREEQEEEKVDKQKWYQQYTCKMSSF